MKHFIEMAVALKTCVMVCLHDYASVWLEIYSWVVGSVCFGDALTWLCKLVYMPRFPGRQVRLCESAVCVFFSIQTRLWICVWMQRKLLLTLKLAFIIHQ